MSGWLGEGDRDDDLHSDVEEGGGMRGIENSLAAVSPDNQCMRQNDEGRDKE